MAATGPLKVLAESKSINELDADLFRDAADARRAERAADPKAARIKAMDFLARREYGQAELIGRVIGSGFLADVTEEVVLRLTAEGLQDDRRFVDSFIAAKVGRGSGPLRIRQALTERGIRGELVDDAMSSIDVDWYAQAQRVRHKKFGDARPPDFKEKARQMRFLQYRGFDMDQISFAMATSVD